MTITAEQMTEAIMEAAALMAAKLKMKQFDKVTDLQADDAALIATSEGIQLGIIKTRHGEIYTYSYITYILNGEIMFERRNAIVEHRKTDQITTRIYLVKDAVIYGNAG